MAAKKKTKKSKRSGAQKMAEDMARHANGAPKEVAKGEVMGQIERKRYKERLPCAIAPELIVLRADELAKAVREREDFAEETRARNASAREKRAHYDEKISELATAVEMHTESRDVEVVEYIVRGQIEVWRLDTHELVTTKAATSEDLQESIFKKIDKAKERAPEAAPAPSDSPVLAEVFGKAPAVDGDIPFGVDDEDDESDTAGA